MCSTETAAAQIYADVIIAIKAAELIHYAIRGFYNSKMLTNQCLWQIRLLSTWVHHILEPCDLILKDTSCSHLANT